MVAAAVVLVTAPWAHAQRGEVLATGFELPVDFAADPTDPGRFYIAEQKTGRIRVIENGKVLPEPFMEVNKGDFLNKDWEQGLLGMALDPAFAQNKRFYLNYSAKDGATHVSRFTATDARSADNKSEELIIEIKQPYPNHNGGCIRFEPDGMLYIGMGDGGYANDPQGNGQNLGVRLGKMLRIDVTANPAYPANHNFSGCPGVQRAPGSTAYRVAVSSKVAAIAPWRATSVSIASRTRPAAPRRRSHHPSASLVTFTTSATRAPWAVCPID